MDNCTGLSAKPPSFAIEISALEYVGSYDHNLMCAICHSPFVQPVKLDCEHVFCNGCISEAFSHQMSRFKNCPACRRKLDSSSVVPVPRVMNQMLDELLVKCPLSGKGCEAKVSRGSVQDHVDQRCEYLEVECPFDEECSELVQRKDIWSGKWGARCLHNYVQCSTCGDMIMELEQVSHTSKHNSLHLICCPDCETKVLSCNLERHLESCPEAIAICPAAPYGCDFTSKRKSLAQHTLTCVLAKLTPFLKLQNDSLSAHEAALKHLQHKNSLLETSFHSLQETLNTSSSLFKIPKTSPSSENAPFDSTAHHLLCLHESLRDEVSRVSAAVSDLDAKTNMMFINEGLRAKEELVHTNAALAAMRMQVHWLMSAKLQNQLQQQQHKVGILGDPEQSQGQSEVGATGTRSSSGSGATVSLGQPVRRLSDSNRQDTKL